MDRVIRNFISLAEALAQTGRGEDCPDSPASR
jgi:hypothetical protein